MYKRHGFELRDSLNFAHIQKISFIRCQGYSLFDVASALASNNLWERRLGPPGFIGRARVVVFRLDRLPTL
jgi:hypothetical protein